MSMFGNSNSMSNESFKDTNSSFGELSLPQDPFRILQLEEVEKIRVIENNEPIISLNQSAPDIICEYQKPAMIEKYGNKMFLREAVVEKLNAIQETIDKSEEFPAGTKLLVAYAYRYLSDQKFFFEQALERMKNRYPEASNTELRRFANVEAAAPEVAGHPTGGAVDVTLRFRDGSMLDTGGGISDFSDPKVYPTLSEEITEVQQKNRLIIRDLMLEQGFAPFNGEWWHFSYGDKEWAAFYGQPNAIYEQVDI